MQTDRQTNKPTNQPTNQPTDQPTNNHRVTRTVPNSVWLFWFLSSLSECTCHFLGTEPSQCVEREDCVCQRASGQCQCRPNVTGLTCDHCAPEHWNLASGSGCEPCGCHPNNSVSSSCNEVRLVAPEALSSSPGQEGNLTPLCFPLRSSSLASVNVVAASEERPAPSVRRTTGGTRGRSVEVTHNRWVLLPHHLRCFFTSLAASSPSACDCDRRGIETSQCNRRTGHCVCLPGVSGVRCDQCARGFSGQFPHCQPCHQCFGDWDRIVQVRLSLGSDVFSSH